MTTFTLDDAIKIGEDLGIDWDTCLFTAEEFLQGLEVELEHGSKLGEQVNVTNDDPILTGKIAWAHLLESPVYYTELAKMEKGFEGEEKRASVRFAFEVPILLRRLVKDLIKTPFIPSSAAVGIGPAYDDPENDWVISIRTYGEDTINPDDLYEIKNLLKSYDSVDLDYIHSPSFPRPRLSATVEDQFGDAAEKINEALEILRDLEDLPGEHEEVIPDLIEDATDLMLALDDETIPREASVKRFRKPRTAIQQRTAIIKPCRQKDIDPGRPKSEQKVCLYSKKDPGKLLGRHPSEESARKQEVAIQINKKADFSFEELGKANVAYLKQASILWMMRHIPETSKTDHFSIYASKDCSQIITANHSNQTAVLFRPGKAPAEMVPYEEIKKAAVRKAKTEKVKNLLKEGFVPPTIEKDGALYIPDLEDGETKKRWLASQRKFARLHKNWKPRS